MTQKKVVTQMEDTLIDSLDDLARRTSDVNGITLSRSDVIRLLLTQSIRSGAPLVLSTVPATGLGGGGGQPPQAHVTPQGSPQPFLESLQASARRDPPKR